MVSLRLVLVKKMGWGFAVTQPLHLAQLHTTLWSCSYVAPKTQRVKPNPGRIYQVFIEATV